MASPTSSPTNGSKPSNPQILKKKKPNILKSDRASNTSQTQTLHRSKHFTDAITNERQQPTKRMEKEIARSGHKLDVPFKQKLHLDVLPDRSSSPHHCARQRRPSALGLVAPSTLRYFISVSVSLLFI